MTPDELLATVQALGVVVTLDAEDLVLRPRSRLSPDLVDQLRTHKAELLDLVELQSWPEASQDAVRRFRLPCARLYPFLDREILTPKGTGRLLQVFPERAIVALGSRPERVSVFLPSELRPPDTTAVRSLVEPRAH